MHPANLAVGERYTLGCPGPSLNVGYSQHDDTPGGVRHRSDITRPLCVRIV